MKNRDIIFLFGYEWENLWGRPHHIMTRLAKNNRILWVEAPQSILYAIKNRKHPWIKWRRGLEKVKKNLWVYRLPYFIPASRLFPILWKFNRRIILNKIRIQLKRLKFSKPILWIYSPRGGSYFIGKFNEIFSCYDRADEYLGDKRFESLFYKEDEAVSKLVDVVFVSSQSLYERHKKYNPNTYLIPNGAEIDLIRKTLKNNSLIPKDIRNIKKPIIGFIGSISYWLDYDLIKFIACSHPDWQIIMIGPIKHNISDLKKMSNIMFLGRKTFEEIPLYVNQFDVGLLPFKINRITKAVSPIKVFEYLAVGIPVVSVDLPEVKKLKPIVKVGHTKEEFVMMLENSINEEKKPKVIQQRIKLAEDNSWNKRVGRMVEIIDMFWRNT